MAIADSPATIDELICSLDPDGAILSSLSTVGDAITASLVSSSAPISLDSTSLADSRRIDRARAYLARIPGAVQGSNGSAPTFEAARVLVHGFCLDHATALGLMLAEYNPRCEPPWSVGELEKKLRDAESRPFSKPRGWLLAERADDREPLLDALPPDAPATPAPALPPVVQPGQATKPASAPVAADSRRNESDDDPFRIAHSILRGYQSRGIRTLQYWRGEFHAWDGTRYVTEPEKEFRGRASQAVWRELETLHRERLAAYDPNSGDDLPKMTKVTRQLVSNVIGAMEGVCLASGLDDAPTWLANSNDGRPNPDPREIVATPAGLVVLPKYAAGDADAILPNTPTYLNFNATRFTPSATAERPAEWLRFLSSLWPDDAESIALLQEWFGYLLTSDTRQQKMLLLVGPPRSGKGTIARVLQDLIGLDNCCNPTLSSLGTNFGLSSLLGKTAAVIEDARLSYRSDVATVTERLLTISGEGRIDVDRKFQTLVNGQLLTRFVVVTNELPRLADASGALAGRWCVLHLVKSFAGREDLTLADRLRPELPGIFNWAVEGWSRLRRQGRFTRPASGADLVQDLQDIGSPIGEFVRDRLQVGESYSVDVEELFDAWQKWCECQGRREPGTANTFGRDLRAFLPAIRKSRARTSAGRNNVYLGVRISPIPGLDSSELGLVSGHHGHHGHHDLPLCAIQKEEEEQCIAYGGTLSGHGDHGDHFEGEI